MPDLLGIAKVSEALSKPVTKLIETVSAGCGVLYEPTRIRRKAQAEADARIITAYAQAEVQNIAQRAGERIAYTEIRNQQNIESIVDKAKELLPAEVSSDPVNPDWTAEFAEQCKRTSDDELQNLWARLLAGEVAKPGTSSRHTLEIVKNLEPLDANAFALIVQTSWQIGGDLYWLHVFRDSGTRLGTPFKHYFKYEEYGIDKIQLTKLRLLNLILPLESGKQLGERYIGQPTVATFQGKRYLISPKEYPDGSRVEASYFANTLTPWGKELSRIVEPIDMPKYREIEIETMKNYYQFTATEIK